MIRLTLGDVRPTISRITQMRFTKNSDAVRDRINEAQQRLISQGKWMNLKWRYSFCTYQDCITLPRELDSILGFLVDKNPKNIESQWFEYLEGGPGEQQHNGWKDAVDRGLVVSFQDINVACQLHVYADAFEAVGSQILIKGINQYGQRVMTFQNITNPITNVTTNQLADGEVVSLVGATPATTVNTFASIDSIVKPMTNGPIRLYAWYGGTTQTPIAYYQPTETNPVYRRYAVPGLQPQNYYNGTSNTPPVPRPHTITVLAKRRFIPAIFDTDDLMISNIGALKNMVIAIEKEEMNEQQNATDYEARAIKCLNDELKEFHGGEKFLPNLTLRGYGGGAVRHTR